MSNEQTRLLNEILIVHAKGEELMKRVAEASGLAHRTVYEHCNDERRNPSVDVIRGAFEVTEDPRLKRLLEPCGWRLVRAAEQAPQTADLEREVADVILAASDALAESRGALRDGVLLPNEAAALRRRFQAVLDECQQCTHLLNEIEGEGGKVRALSR